ncbi:MAG TPA: 1-deoxy-D-xylulose-5-phosphate synthase, partial [Lentisphaeria bacterium]|nr:1-deoxy-D-xylulose-5-phosphate synthase [Lentisphaeria bacterium]
DEALMRQQLDDGMRVVTLEDHNIASGFGSIAKEFFAGHASGRIEKLGWPNEVLGWGSPAGLRERYGLTAAAIAERLRALL